jgi:GGDEF domain-containing protein
VPPSARGEEIEIRDERGEEGPSAWIGSIGRQLDGYRQDGVPFAVLLLEPLEIDRLRRADSPEGLQRMAAEIEEALALHWPGSFTRQRPARYWLLAPATNRLSAPDLAERLQASLSSALRYQGDPLQVAIGTATCPDDGLEASALAAHADVGLYAARSALRRASERNPRTPAPVDESA